MKVINSLNNHTKGLIIFMVLFAICACYYLYRNFQRTNNEVKLILVLLICTSIFLSYTYYQESISIIALKSNYGLSNGKISKYFVSNKVSLRGGSGSNYIEYYYQINNKQFKNRYEERGYIDIPSTKPDLEIEYLVLYQKNKPQNSAILINYPVRNTDDFEKYKLLFKNNIPKNVFKRD